MCKACATANETQAADRRTIFLRTIAVQRRIDVSTTLGSGQRFAFDEKAKEDSSAELAQSAPGDGTALAADDAGLPAAALVEVDVQVDAEAEALLPAVVELVARQARPAREEATP